jgi:tRNA G37 N-methylase TrmD
LVIIDAVARLIPGVVGNQESVEEESFSHGLLEYPHYTRPEEFRGMRVPEVLLSGNHANIACWRRQQSLLRTRERRPDLLSRAGPGQVQDKSRISPRRVPDKSKAGLRQIQSKSKDSSETCPRLVRDLFEAYPRLVRDLP